MILLRKHCLATQRFHILSLPIHSYNTNVHVNGYLSEVGNFPCLLKSHVHNHYSNISSAGGQDTSAYVLQMSKCAFWHQNEDLCLVLFMYLCCVVVLFLFIQLAVSRISLSMHFEAVNDLK